MSSLGRRFLEVAEKHANRPALRWEHQELSYADLREWAGGVAGRVLASDSRGPVGIRCDRRHEEVAALLGVLLAGRPYAVLSPGQRPAGLELVLAGAEQADEPGELPEVDPEALASLVYTSGSSGGAKAVMRSHRAILHRIGLAGETHRLGPDDRVSHLFSCAYVAAEVDVLGALLHGGCLCCLEDLSGLGDWLRQERITTLHPPVSFFRRFLLHQREALAVPVRLIALAGEPVYARDLERLWRTFPGGPEVVLRFSATETSNLTVRRLLPGDPLEEGPLALGQAVADKRLELVDEQGRPVPAGQVGRLRVHSPFLASGYWNDPEATRRSFGTGCFESADLARWGERGLEHLGRQDGVVKVRGQRVHPAEVERALLAQPEVEEAAVVALPDALGELRLRAWYSGPAQPEELRRRLAAQLRPASLPDCLIPLDRLPLTPTGKLDRRALAPADPLERQLAALWTELLPEGGDDFVRAGGDSLLAAELSLRARQLGLDIRPHDLAEAPTPRAMAIRLRAVRGPEGLVRLQVGRGGRPLFVFPPSGADLTGFARLASRLPSALPVYGLWSRALSVKAMAGELLELLRRTQPQGPYRLAGRCAGCMLALEVARRLRASGEEVELLAMIGGRAVPRIWRDGPRWDLTRRLVSLVRDPFRPRRLTMGLLVRLGQVELDVVQRVASWHYHAGWGYAGRALLLDLAGPDGREPEHVTGWRRVIRGGVTWARIDEGTRLFQEPSLSQVVRVLEGYL